LAPSAERVAPSSTEADTPLLDVRNIKKHFKVGGGFLGGDAIVIRRVDDVSFKVFPGETFGLVGESGCGKTTLGQTIIRLYDPTDGTITFAARTSRPSPPARCGRSGATSR
jgi:ABC-type oligopeptide transport system ATPase subunit